MIYVFDAGALIAYLRKEPGHEIVRSVLCDASQPSFVHAVNMCEVYYDAFRIQGADIALEVVSGLIATGLVLRADLTPEFWQAAGRIKAIHRRISLADCFAIALARDLGGTVVTTDHHEFDAVAAANLCPVTFIR